MTTLHELAVEVRRAWRPPTRPRGGWAAAVARARVAVIRAEGRHARVVARGRAQARAAREAVERARHTLARRRLEARGARRQAAQIRQWARAARRAS